MEQEFLMKISELVEVKKPSFEMKIHTDLLINSLKYVKVILDLEDYYGIEFDDDELFMDGTYTLNDLYQVIFKKVTAKSNENVK